MVLVITAGPRAN